MTYISFKPKKNQYFIQTKKKVALIRATFYVLGV